MKKRSPHLSKILIGLLCLVICLATAIRLVFPPAETNEEPAPTVPAETCPDPHSSDPNIRFAKSFSSLQEYQSYFSTAPADFVTYDMLTCFGQFRSWYNDSGTTGLGNSFYTFSDKTGAESVSLYVYQMPEEYIWAQTAHLLPLGYSGGLDDNLEERGKYQVGKLTYEYHSGKLAFIYWHTQGYSFKLQMGTYVNTRKNADRTNAFLEQLLQISTAKTALRKFEIDLMAALGQTLQEPAVKEMPFDLLDTETAPYPAVTYPLNFVTLSKYEAYFAQAPSDFLTYDMVKELGEFRGYTSMSVGNIDAGCYRFCNEKGEPTATLYFYKNHSGRNHLKNFCTTYTQQLTANSFVTNSFTDQDVPVGTALQSADIYGVRYPDVLWTNGTYDFMLRFEPALEERKVSLNSCLYSFTQAATVDWAAQTFNKAVEKTT